MELFVTSMVDRTGVAQIVMAEVEEEAVAHGIPIGHFVKFVDDPVTWLTSVTIDLIQIFKDLLKLPIK